ELPRIERVAYVPGESALVVRLVRIPTPAGRNLLERGDHAIAVHLHLYRPRVVRPGDEFRNARVRGVRDIDDAPAEMPQVSHVQVPALADLPDGHLEARPLAELAVADDLDVLPGAAGRNGISKGGSGQSEQARERCAARKTNGPHVSPPRTA